MQTTDEQVEQLNELEQRKYIGVDEPVIEKREYIHVSKALEEDGDYTPVDVGME